MYEVRLMHCNMLNFQIFYNYVRYDAEKWLRTQNLTTVLGSLTLLNHDFICLHLKKVARKTASLEIDYVGGNLSETGRSITI